MIYTDKENGITIIEIQKDDGFNSNRFLELNSKKEVEINSNDSLYLYHLDDNRKLIKYKCKIKNRDEENNCFEYECNCEKNKPLTGCPIIVESINNNYEIIGMHKEINDKNEYIGIFIKKPINKFLNEIKVNNYKNLDKKYSVDLALISDKEEIKNVVEIILRYKI